MTTSTVEVPTTTVLLRFGDERVTVPISCEPVDDVWAITPGVTVPTGTLLPELTGRFTITHRSTGYGIGVQACIGCTRASAAQLATTGWARSVTDVASVTPPTPEVYDALTTMRACLAENCDEV